MPSTASPLMCRSWASRARGACWAICTIRRARRFCRWGRVRAGCVSWPISSLAAPIRRISKVAMAQEIMTSLLEDIDSPADLRRLDRSELKGLATELRAFVLDSVSRTGGHLSSNLGVVELTLALHYVFHTPEDRLVWDVGHQSYAHKILTGRREAMPGLRQLGGISGFPRRSESPYD